jgi:lysosomal alpha-mannosidase
MILFSDVSTIIYSTCIKSQTVQTAVIIFNNWTSQEISLYDGAEVVEVEWTVGPIPIDGNNGKEIIMRYNTDIQSQSKFYTDANGREVLERTRDYRPTWNYTVNEPVSGNYYPINSRIWIKDQNKQLTVLTDRSHGGGSIHDGSVEIMLHRRLLYDDGFGVGEALNESAFGKGLVIRGRHVLAVESPAASAFVHRVLSQQLFMHPLVTFTLTQQTYQDYSAAYRQTWSALTDTLPLNVHLLTLDQLSTKNYLVRVENYFELNEDIAYSRLVTFDLQSIFQSVGTISNTVELTLAANLQLSDLQRLNWVTDDGQLNEMKVPSKFNK